MNWRKVLMKKLTSFTHLNTGEGDRISFTFSEIGESGNIESRNNKGSFIVMDNTLMEHINAIKQYINENHLG